MFRTILNIKKKKKLINNYRNTAMQYTCTDKKYDSKNNIFINIFILFRKSVLNYIYDFLVMMYFIGDINTYVYVIIICNWPFMMQLFYNKFRNNKFRDYFSRGKRSRYRYVYIRNAKRNAIRNHIRQRSAVHITVAFGAYVLFINFSEGRKRR